MTAHGPILDRMRANLAAARIALSDGDLEAIANGPFLDSVVAFDRRGVEEVEGGLPDYLADVDRSTAAGARADGAVHTAVTTDRGMPRPAPPESLAALAERIRGRDTSPLELTRQVLDRIAERDPLLNVFQLVLSERALESARRAEEEISRGSYRGPLHGVPIAIKDLMAMKGTPTTAGSRILAGVESAYDAASVERLEHAGAVVVGKTRMSEFAYLPGSSNAHYGPTRNPHDRDRDAGGSSSGSAAAVADGLVYAAIGTDTGGSIRVPAALCGVVGLKPTFGRISLHGVVPLSWSLDHLGPLTRTVGDAALTLQTLAGADPRDGRTSGQIASAPLRLDVEAGVRGVRIGVPDRLPAPGSLASEGAWAAARHALAELESAGAELIPVELPELEDLWIANNVILAIEAAAFHQRWLQERLQDYGEIPRHRLLAAYAHAPNSFVRAQALRRSGRERMSRLFGRVDLLGLPAQPDGAPPLGEWRSTLLTGPFNALGWPAVTVPAGTSAEGLPLGLQLIGRAWEEELVLRGGRVVEIGLTS